MVNLSDKIKREICEIAHVHGVKRVVLFGSRAKNTHTEKSDIDIAVYGGDFDGLYWEIKEKVHTLLIFDIVNMDSDVSDELKDDIERDGVVIYEKD